MWTPEYYVRYLPFPPRVNGTVVTNDDGSFDIYINESFDEVRRAEALRHELEHILRDHFYRELDIAQKEREAGSRLRLESARETETPGAAGIIYESPSALYAAWRKAASAEAVSIVERSGGALIRLKKGARG